jgi:adenylate cyclase
MVDRDEGFGLEGEERELTVLFSDVRGFTAFSETVPPSSLTSVMNRLLTPLTEAIQQHRGTIDKYMGDAVMAFWGAPLHDPHHADHAISGAFSMLEAIDSVNEQLTAEGYPALAMGIGLNTGSMSVGNMGSSFRMAYTVLGDEVNLGSRIEGLTKTYGVPLIVSEQTADAAPDWIYRRLDQVRVKGRQAPVWLLEPLGRRAVIDADRQAWVAAFDAALERYQSRDFAGAAAAFSALPADDGPTALYLERIRQLQLDPPPADWDGVWDFQVK